MGRDLLSRPTLLEQPGVACSHVRLHERRARVRGSVYPGAQVTVTDAAGATIAIDRLGRGEIQSFGCVFNFSVSDVPSGKKFYGVEVSHRGVLKYSEAEISTQALTLTLG